MLLAVDAGNTNIVFSVFDGDEAVGEWRCSNNVNRTADEHGVWICSLLTMQGVTAAAITEAIIATVVPAGLFNLKTLCRKYFDVEPLVVGSPDLDLGIAIKIDKPDEVGADRLVNAIAAHHVYGGALIVIDFGTATTFDVVEADGSYLGGAIAPGINLSLSALHAAAAKLPRVSIGRPEQVIGKSTVEAMRSGIFWGYVGLIEGLVCRLSNSLPQQQVTVIATGGLASVFTPVTDTIDHLDQGLTMKGLCFIHRRATAQHCSISPISSES